MPDENMQPYIISNEYNITEILAHFDSDYVISTIEDKLEEIISNESVDMIEEFLGYELTFNTPEDIHSQVRDVLDQMPEEELLLWEERYDLL